MEGTRKSDVMVGMTETVYRHQIRRRIVVMVVIAVVHLQ